MKPHKSLSLKTHSGYSVLLIVLFLLFFGATVALIVKIGGEHISIGEDASLPIGADYFRQAVDIRGRGAYLKVAHSQDIQPKAGKAFLIVAWFKMDSLPKEGERVFLLSKYDGSSPSKSGYALALKGKYQGVNPEVYWRDEKSLGGWYVFSEVSIVPNVWFLTAIAFYEERYLAVYISTINASGEIHLDLAGGYELSQPVYPSSSAQLKFGSVKTGHFKGNIGPVGVFYPHSLGNATKTKLESFLKDPFNIPSWIKGDEVILWVPDGSSDKGPFEFPIKIMEPKRIKNLVKG
ncbi:MAG: hypothetical protein D6808_03895 [Candidatus Dadabacteria bacterium]|nr:MAG: hypothetical protein D6808_03895 [Candidatus Dadabacteria bacterium]